MNSKTFVRAAALAAHLAIVASAHAAPAADSGNAPPRAAAGPTVAYNEAVRIVGGKRVVELPPLNPYSPKQFVPPAGSHVLRNHAYMVETPNGLLQCTVPFYAKAGCEPSTYGSVRQRRTWVVLHKGEWKGCIGLDAPKQCRALYPKQGSTENHLGGVIPAEVS